MPTKASENNDRTENNKKKSDRDDKEIMTVTGREL